jgi:hypothetical protein
MGMKVVGLGGYIFKIRIRRLRGRSLGRRWLTFSGVFWMIEGIMLLKAVRPLPSFLPLSFVKLTDY